MSWRLSLFVIFFGLFPLFSPPFQYGSRRCPQELEWLETNTEQFAIIYATRSAEVEQLLFTTFGDRLDTEYLRIKAAYDTTLPLSPSIRIYPTEDFYYCLNALPPELDPGDTHAHIGSLEIAIIEENILANPQEWFRESLNALRFEIASLFIEHITDSDLPAGLAIAAATYSQHPEDLLSSFEIPDEMKAAPTKSWRILWQSSLAKRDTGFRIQAMSTVAFLVDVYGWPKFLEFLGSLPTSAGYRQALITVYGVEPTTLEEQWQEYYPFYLEGRWRANAIYGFDLTAFEDLLSAGAYADAIAGLKELIEYLDGLGDTVKAAEARELLAVAHIGQQAGAMVGQTRQALLAGEYQQAIELADKAANLYNQIDDQRRLDEIQVYRERAEEVLELRTTLALINPYNKDGLDGEQVATIREIGSRLAELGDEQGNNEAEGILVELQNEQADEIERLEQEERDRLTTITIAGVFVCGLILGHRVWITRKHPPPESQLI